MGFKVKGLWKKGNSFYWRYKHEGVTKYVPLESITEERAIAELLKIKGNPATCQTDTFEIEVDLYIKNQLELKKLSKTFAPGRAYVLKRFGKDMGITRPEQVSPSVSLRFYRSLLDRGLTESTAQGYVNGLRAFCGWLVRRGKLQRNPVEGIEMNRIQQSGRKNFVQKEMVKKLIKHAPDDDLRFVLYCGFHAGLRKMEIIEAIPKWFDLRHGCLTVEGTDHYEPKDKERRSIPLTNDFKAFLNGYGIKSPHPLKPEIPRGLAKYRYDFRRPFDEYMELMGVKCTAHDMRRSFASNLVIAGVDVFKVAKWLGDGIQVVQKHYAHLLPNDSSINKLV